MAAERELPEGKGRAGDQQTLVTGQGERLCEERGGETLLKSWELTSTVCPQHRAWTLLLLPPASWEQNPCFTDSSPITAEKKLSSKVGD